jgi:hypothetical protein
MPKQELSSSSAGVQVELVQFDDSTVNAEESRLIAEKLCASDDEHLLALARVSGARVVCTEDHGVWIDMKNKELVDTPRGRVYRTAEHVSLLHHDSGCQKPPSQKRTTARHRRKPR